MAFARYFMRLSLAIWIGGLVFFPFLAQNAFSTLASRQSAGLIVGKSLMNLHWIGLGCGVVFLICSVASRGARKFAVRNLSGVPHDDRNFDFAVRRHPAHGRDSSFHSR